MRRATVTLVLLLALHPACVEAVPDGNDGGRASSSGLQENHCADCHTCQQPTRENPCLAPCPRHSPDQGPDVVLIDQLSAQYVPVVFAHKLHAQMTEMTGGCAACHHFNESRRILRCQECHSISNPDKLGMPGLRGAFHRQCLSCHREWSHETECAVCHAKKTAESVAVVAPDPTDIMGILHPNAEEPVIKIYQTDYEHGKQVTFRHQAHVLQFGFKCVSCHREANCGNCHRPADSPVPARTLQEHHSPCAVCHETEGKAPETCAHCHSDTATPPFTHARTGLVLNEDHQDLACRDCHTGATFHEPPTCSECHEEDINYPAQLPGTRLETP